VSGPYRALRVRHPWVALVFAALASGTCSSPSPPRKPPSTPLVLAGTEYLAPLFRAEILAFQDHYPEADSIRIRANGSAEGMEQLVNGEVSMSLLLRELTDPEVDAAVKRNGLQAFTVAWDAVAVIRRRRSSRFLEPNWAKSMGERSPNGPPLDGGKAAA
jgi:ABC-type phosphate transport system substrate-binding protein